MEASESLIPWEILEAVKKKVGSSALVSIDEAKSAQQRVFIIKFNANIDTVKSSSPLPKILESGGYRLVLRIWKGGSRWWNLNQAKNVRALASTEVAGYQLAHTALQDKIPKLIYFSIDQEGPPWALLEYVGEASARFDETSKVYDQYWTKSMIKVRDEFGFSEQHPRWGRVPVQESLSYAVRVLDQIILPLHKFFFENPAVAYESQAQFLFGPFEGEKGYTYDTMVCLYKDSLDNMQNSMKNSNIESKDFRLADSLLVLEKCLDEICSRRVEPLPFVLLHSKLDVDAECPRN